MRALNTDLPGQKTISLHLGRIPFAPQFKISNLVFGIKKWVLPQDMEAKLWGWVRSWPNMIGLAPITSTGCQAWLFTNNGTTFDTVSCHRNWKNGCHECVSKRWLSHTGWPAEKCLLEAVLSRVSWLRCGATKGWKVSESDVVHLNTSSQAALATVLCLKNRVEKVRVMDVS